MRYTLRRVAISTLLISLGANMPVQAGGTDKKHGYAPVNGLKMYYEIQGPGGTPLVLLHGGGSSF
jgi:hypothetical protein